MVSQFGLEGHVQLPGVLTGESKWDQFAGANVLVFPSVAPMESYPLVLLEAMMWKLPIVATDWRANAEILGNPPGGVCFLPGEDLADTLRAAIEACLHQRDSWREWGRVNRERYLAVTTFEHEPLLNAVKAVLAANASTASGGT
jgi:glycosyltransferase involved in cell wall biosynthesis